MSQTATPKNGSPNHHDRNQSIVWARYLIDSPDWLVLSTRVTRASSEAGPQVSPIKLLSLSLLTPSGKVICESMLKPQEMIPSSLISEHCLDQSVVFNALPCSDILLNTSKLIAGKQILTWDLKAEQSIFDQLCGQNSQPILPLHGNSLCQEYARYAGDYDSQAGAYKLQALPGAGAGATASATEICRAILATLTNMASTSQTRDTAQTGHQGWTAEFYKPKINTKDKIKDFLGL